MDEDLTDEVAALRRDLDRLVASMQRCPWCGRWTRGRLYKTEGIDQKICRSCRLRENRQRAAIDRAMDAVESIGNLP